MDTTGPAAEATGRAKQPPDAGYLLVEVRQPKSKPLFLAVRDDVEIGRDCDGLLLSDPEVSRRHVVLRREGDRLTIEDLQSTNGTTVNGAPLEAAVPLSEADVVCLGGTELRLLPTTGRARSPKKLVLAPGASSGPRGTTFAAGGSAVVRGKTDASGARMTSIDAVADAVDEEGAKVGKLADAGGTITIVFSDIESSTEMAVSLGDTKWFEVLGEHDEVIRRNLKRHKGTVVKHQGDGFMLTFPGARSAVLCMIDVQREFTERASKEAETPIRVRIGMHTGEAIVDAEGDLFGKHIIMAARIANLAEGGQILVSSLTKEITSSRGDLEFGASQEVTLKGIEGTHQVHEVVWAEPGDGEESTAPS